MTPAEKHRYADFTEENYRKLIKLAKERFQFVGYAEHETQGDTVLWRHDVDYSLHRARALARIEHEEGVKSTFFIYPHCYFYNLFDIEVLKCATEILSLGHDIGLHADFGFICDCFTDKKAREEFFMQEKALMENALGCSLSAISFHQPELRNVLDLNDSHYVGMINTYSKDISQRYEYCSDSNGHWRYRRLDEVLKDTSISNLHVLTHPAWWTPEALSPAARIMRCIQGQKEATWRRYCEELKASKRENENYGAEEFQ